MDQKEIVIILNDIHMGSNSPTVCYSKKIHENFLIAILDDIIACANHIKELVLLGDIFEFWTYPPNVVPPELDDIIAAHPNILGQNGKLNQVISALKGRVVFIPGDHDICVTEADLRKIKNQDGYTIKFHTGAYIPSYDKGVLFTHGNEFTILNAPYYESKLAPLPLGYFISRAISYYLEKELGKSFNQTAANLLDNANHYIANFILKNQAFFNYILNSRDFISEFINVIAYTTGMPLNLKIHINLDTAVSLNDIKKIYEGLIPSNQIMQLFSLITELSGYYLPYVAQKCAIGKGANLVIAGHTHVPVSPVSDGICQYANTGFMCPSLHDMQIKPITYGIYDCSNRYIKLMKISDDTSHNIESYIKNKTISTKNVTTDPLTFGWSVYNESWEYYRMMQDGVRLKAKELNINLITHDQKSNSIEMVTGCLNLINKEVNALLISPYNPEKVPIIVSKAKIKEIPVVIIDGGTGGADVLAFIVSDSFAGGVLAGEYALTLTKKYAIKSNNVTIIKAEETATYALRRGKGFKCVMLESGYQVVSEVSANGEETLAYEEMKNILNSYGNDLAVVFCENGNMTLGAAKAIEEAGKKGEIMLIGFDADKAIIDAIKQGVIQGTIAQQPFKMGEIGVEIAYLAMEGKPITYDDRESKEILMEVYLIDESGKPSIKLR